ASRPAPAKSRRRGVPDPQARRSTAGARFERAHLRESAGALCGHLARLQGECAACLPEEGRLHQGGGDHGGAGVRRPLFRNAAGDGAQGRPLSRARAHRCPNGAPRQERSAIAFAGLPRALTRAHSKSANLPPRSLSVSMKPALILALLVPTLASTAAAAIQSRELKIALSESREVLLAVPDGFALVTGSD